MVISFINLDIFLGVLVFFFKEFMVLLEEMNVVIGISDLVFLCFIDCMFIEY